MSNSLITKTKLINSKQLFLFIVILTSMVSCGQTDPNKEIDEGKIENNIYTSKEIGWTIKIPEKWKITSKKQSQKFEKIGMKAFKKVYDGEIDISNLKRLISFQKNSFNNFHSTSEPYDLEYYSEWGENNAMLKQLLYDTFKNKGIKVDTTGTEIVKIDGVYFNTYEFKIFSPKDEKIFTQLIYSSLINGFDFGVNLMYNNELDKNIMLNSWLNSKFEK